jgi:hypothetical protein
VNIGAKSFGSFVPGHKGAKVNTPLDEMRGQSLLLFRCSLLLMVTL